MKNVNTYSSKGTSSDLNLKSLKKRVFVRFILAYVGMGLMFFLPARTFNYWQVWVYMLILSVPLIFIVRYLYKHDPKLLERRMRTREKQKTQKLIQGVSWPFFLAAFIVPGFDHRSHWSNVSLPITIISYVLVLFGYLIVVLVFKANSYTSRIIEVEKDQKVVTTGPYAVVRHPMYLGVLIFYIFSPLALGSYWALIPALLIVPILVARIGGEEKELLENLEGYKEYVMKTKYRLVPGIW